MTTLTGDRPLHKHLYTLDITDKRLYGGGWDAGAHSTYWSNSRGIWPRPNSVKNYLAPQIQSLTLNLKSGDLKTSLASGESLLKWCTRVSCQGPTFERGRHQARERSRKKKVLWRFMKIIPLKGGIRSRKRNRRHLAENIFKLWYYFLNLD